MEIKHISNEEYHAAPGLSKSAIKLVLDDPHSYYWKYILGKDLGTSDSKKFGQAVHQYLLEPTLFKQNFFITKHSLATKAGIADKKRAEEKKKNIIKYDALRDMVVMKKELYKCPNMLKLLHGGVIEGSIFWTDKQSGLTLKTRPDYLKSVSLDGQTTHFILDLKSCATAMPRKFSNDLYEYGYHIQAAMAIDGLKALGAHETDNFVFIFLAVEKKAPFNVLPYEIDEASIELGRQEYRAGIDRYLDCKKNNTWYSYIKEPTAPGISGLETISVPYWAFNKAA